jgi:hypothetical protein
MTSLAFVLAFATVGTTWINDLGGRTRAGADGQVREVYLRASWVTDGDLLQIAALPGLQTLDLSRTRITDQGLAYLRNASSLVDVNLAYAEKIGDPAHAVVKSWKKVQRLNLRGTVIADETAASAASLPDLEILDIADTLVGDVGMESLAAAQKLRELSIGNIRMSEAGFQSLRQFTTLTTLDISGKRHGGPSNITANGIAAIASLRNLEVLKLGHTRFPEKSFAQLAEMPAVQRLGLEFCPEIGDDAVEQLARWKSLRWVDLHGTKITADGAASLRKQRPDLQVLWE